MQQARLSGARVAVAPRAVGKPGTPDRLNQAQGCRWERGRTREATGALPSTGASRWQRRAMTRPLDRRGGKP